MFVRLKIILVYTLGIRKFANIDGQNKLWNLGKNTHADCFFINAWIFQIQWASAQFKYVSSFIISVRIYHEIVLKGHRTERTTSGQNVQIFRTFGVIYCYMFLTLQT